MHKIRFIINFEKKIMSYNVGTYENQAKKPKKLLDKESAILANPLIGSETDRIK